MVGHLGTAPSISWSQTRRITFFLVPEIGPPGLEPEITDSKSAVLPLHQRPFKMEPAVGIEPTTVGLQNQCSTTELCWPYVPNI